MGYFFISLILTWLLFEDTVSASSCNFEHSRISGDNIYWGKPGDQRVKGVKSDKGTPSYTDFVQYFGSLDFLIKRVLRILYLTRMLHVLQNDLVAETNIIYS